MKDLRRDIKKLEMDLLDSQKEKMELCKYIDSLKLTIKDKQGEIDKVKTEKQDKNSAVETLYETIQEKDLQIEAMLLKMDMFKKNMDEVNFKYLEAQQLLDQMKS